LSRRRSPRWELLGDGAFLAMISTSSISGGPVGAFAAVISTSSISGGPAGAFLAVAEVRRRSAPEPRSQVTWLPEPTTTGTHRWLRKAR
jgi:hypothetical protein